MNRSRRPLAAALALVFAVLLAACGGGDDSGADPDTSTDASSGDTVPAGEGDEASGDDADEVVTIDADLDLPCSVTYAGVEITITGATFSNATPLSIGSDEPVAGDDELLYLEVSTEFEDGFAGDDGFFPIGNSRSPPPTTPTSSPVASTSPPSSL
ncbi:MAG: hypothetical protein JJE52_08495 [Acidimicrobiia bacterium]|nr:hypothetical protein [Acidimicrobiia bacterium]